MIYIKNFNHNFESSIITFEVENDGVTNKVETKESDYGATSTDIDSFPDIEDWSDAEYSQLEDFLSGCEQIVHQFYH